MIVYHRTLAAVLAALFLIFLSASAKPGAAVSEVIEVTTGDEPGEVTATVVQPAGTIAATPLPEQELVELAGYYMAHVSGVASLQLDAEMIAGLADTVAKVLDGELEVSSFGQEAIQAAISEASARGEAIRTAIAPDASQGTAVEPKALGAEALAKLPAIGETSIPVLGAIVAAQSRMADLGFSGDEISTLMEGFKRGAADVQPDSKVLANSQQIGTFLQSRAQAAQARAAVEAAAAAGENKAAGIAFIEALEGAESTDSGLHFKVIEPGEGPKPTMEDSVRVHYKGTRIDGTVFDSSYDRGQPTDFPMGGVVPGFSEGLTKVAAGGKVKLYIPSDLAYGDSPRPGGKIQPGDTLIFECELVEINPDS